MRHSSSSPATVATAEDRDLVAAVRKFRTRARMVVFFNQLLTAIAVGAAATGVWNIAWAPTAPHRWMAFAVTLAVALVAAVALTYLRAPTLGATASAVDGRLNLQDRIVAALQVGREPGAVSTLIVHDAARCLRGANPADVFPLDVGRRAVAAMLLLTIALLTVTADLPRAVSTRQPGTGAGAGAAASGTAQAEGARSAAAASHIEAPAVSSGSTIRPAETTTSRPIDSPLADPPAANARGVTDGAPSSSAEAETPSMASAASPPNEAEARARIARTDAPAALPSDGGGTGTDRRGQSAAAGQSRAALGAMPGGGGASPDSGRLAGGIAGGVAAGTLGASLPSVTPADSRAIGRSAFLAGVARAKAEAVMSRDDIPPARRPYVRDYFLRLQSTGGPR